MKTRMIKCFAIMFAFITIGYMAVSMGRVRVANAEDVSTSTVLDTSGTSVASDTSGTSSSDSGDDEEDDDDKKDSGGSSSGGCCG